MTARTYGYFFIFLLVFMGIKTFGEISLLGEDEAKEVESRVETLFEKAKSFVDKEDSLGYAIKLYEEAYGISEKEGYTKGIILSTSKLGTTYLTLANNAKATNYFYISLRNAEISDDTSGVASAYLGLGLVMYNLGNYDEGLTYFNKSKKKYLDADTTVFVKVLDYLIGISHFQTNNFNQSKLYLEDVYADALERSDSSRIFESKLYLLNIESKLKPSVEVLKEYEKILSYFLRKNEKVGECHTRDWLARLQLKLGMVDEAVANANRALFLSKNAEVATTLKTALEVSIETAYASRNFEKAATYLKELQAIKDSVNSVGETTRIAMMNAGYEFDKKESLLNLELAQRNKQRFILLILLGTSLLAVFAIFFSLKSVGRQRKISDKLLLNILPADTARELKKSGIAKAKFHTDVTIVFADVKSFTAIASQMKATDLVQMLDYYFREFDAIVEEMGLEKIKTIGDAYMFVVGLSDSADSAHKAVDASLKMLHAANIASVEMRKQFGESFKFRFGMHTGNVVSGVVGHIKYAFDIWGDAVNIAARMESNSEPGRINISEDTYQLVKDKFECTPRGPIEAKNRGILEMYFVERIR